MEKQAYNYRLTDFIPPFGFVSFDERTKEGLKGIEGFEREEYERKVSRNGLRLLFYNMVTTLFAPVFIGSALELLLNK